MRVFMYFAGMIVGSVIGAFSVLLAGFIIDSNKDDDDRK